MARSTEKNLGWPHIFRAFSVLCAIILLLAQSGADGGRGSRLARGNLKFHITSNFLCHLKQHLLR